MKSLTSWFILIVSIALLVSSCAKSDDSKTATTSSTDDTTSSSDDSSSTTELEGTWVTSCNTASWDNNYYVIETITVSGSALVWKWDEHSDSSCSNDYILWTDNHSSLSLGNEVTLDNGSKATKFTMKVDSLEGLMKTSAAATDYNNYVWCGDSDWALNTAKDYSGKTCNGVTYPAKNATISGVYKLDGSSLLINTDNITSVGSTVFTKGNSTSTSDNSSSSSSSSGSGVFVTVGGISSGPDITTYVYKSTDNGSTWDNASIPYVGNHGSSSIAFGDNTFVSVSAWGAGNSLIRSTDNGSTWDNVTGGQEALVGVAYGNNTFVAVNKYITRSTDNGTTWDNASAPTGIDISSNQNFLKEIAFGNNSFVAVGSYGNIIRSTNNGSSWDNATWVHTVEMNSTLSDVSFGNNTFVAVGMGNKIIRSTDNGSTWDNATVPSGINSFNDVAFGNNTFVAITSVCGPCKSYVVRSTDNGSSWDNGTISVGELQIYDVEFGNGVFIITSQGGLILRSTDNGSTWDNMTQYDSNLPNITAVGISN